MQQRWGLWMGLLGLAMPSLLSCTTPVTLSEPGGQVETRRTVEGPQPGAWQGPGVGLGAQASAAASQGRLGHQGGTPARGLTHGSVNGRWRLTLSDATSVVMQELWDLADEGQVVRGTRRYDPAFDPALAVVAKRQVLGTWALGKDGAWMVELTDPAGALVLIGEQSLNFIPITPGEAIRQGERLSTSIPAESPASTAPKPGAQASTQPTPITPAPSPTAQAEGAASAQAVATASGA